MFAASVFRYGLWLVVIAVVNGIVGCDGSRQDQAFDGGPRGYVEFYIPADDPALTELHVDAQIWQMVDGERRFAGMTKKWKSGSGQKHGLVVPVAPGEHEFSVEVAGGATPVKVRVGKDDYLPVRITASGITRTQLMGMSNRIQFRIDATPEPAAVSESQPPPQ